MLDRVKTCRIFAQIFTENPMCQVGFYKKSGHAETTKSRREGCVECIYILDFLKMLWNGELF